MPLRLLKSPFQRNCIPKKNADEKPATSLKSNKDGTGTTLKRKSSAESKPKKRIRQAQSKAEDEGLTHDVTEHASMRQAQLKSSDRDATQQNNLEQPSRSSVQDFLEFIDKVRHEDKDEPQVRPQKEASIKKSKSLLTKKKKPSKHGTDNDKGQANKKHALLKKDELKIDSPKKKVASCQDANELKHESPKKKIVDRQEPNGINSPQPAKSKVELKRDFLKKEGSNKESPEIKVSNAESKQNLPKRERQHDKSLEEKDQAKGCKLKADLKNNLSKTEVLNDALLDERKGSTLGKPEPQLKQNLFQARVLSEESSYVRKTLEEAKSLAELKQDLSQYDEQKSSKRAHSKPEVNQDLATAQVLIHEKLEENKPSKRTKAELKQDLVRAGLLSDEPLDGKNPSARAKSTAELQQDLSNTILQQNLPMADVLMDESSHGKISSTQAQAEAELKQYLAKRELLKAELAEEEKLPNLSMPMQAPVERSQTKRRPSRMTSSNQQSLPFSFPSEEDAARLLRSRIDEMTSSSDQYLESVISRVKEQEVQQQLLLESALQMQENETLQRARAMQELQNLALAQQQERNLLDYSQLVNSGLSQAGVNADMNLLASQVDLSANRNELAQLELLRLSALKSRMNQFNAEDVQSQVLSEMLSEKLARDDAALNQAMLGSDPSLDPATLLRLRELSQQTGVPISTLLSSMEQRGQSASLMSQNDDLMLPPEIQAALLQRSHHSRFGF